VRDGKGLQEALDLLQKIKSDDLPQLSAAGSSPIFNKGLIDALEAIHMTKISELVTRAALMREESRRSHYRTDFLDLDNKKWLCNTVIKKENGRTILTTVPPVMTRMEPSGTEGVWE
jgi:succinate dehydrogenase/fumarate reductase flavoprotein subunit